MYDWILEANDDAGSIITANRRLARLLRIESSAQQQLSGKTAWQTPIIYSWQDWLVTLAANTIHQDDFPTRINISQSQLLWETCLREEVTESEGSIGNLVRLSRDAWQRLSDWRISIAEVARAAQSDDQKLFAAVAGRYLGILKRGNMVDDAGLTGLILEQIQSGNIRLSGRHTFAGFDRERPAVTAMHQTLTATGIEVCLAPIVTANRYLALRTYEHIDAELRAAGAWARQQLESNPKSRIAIVVTGLDKDADALTRSVREGATPAWQYGHKSLQEAVNVSYGRRLSEYPAVAVACLLLRWLVRNLSSLEVGVLLRSPLLGSGIIGGRTRLELQLRQVPDRQWSPSMLTAQFRGRDDGINSKAWLIQLAEFSKTRRDLPMLATPAQWAILLTDALKQFNWPGQGALSSTDFQLINRWFELLNDFARLGLVSAPMSPTAAISRLEFLANDTIFQPESTSAMVQLLGPLEASGAEFDALWLTGITTANWPPAGTPSPLISRRLQEKHGMPDCTPANTLDYAQRMLTRLVASSVTTITSFALNDDDSEQTASDLLGPMQLAVQKGDDAPGFHAAELSVSATLKEVDDSIPTVEEGEQISGGAGTIQRQCNDPITAFLHGRMGVRVIYPQAVGIPAAMRGNLIHDALYKLYIDLPSQDNIKAWGGGELERRIALAVDFAFARHEKNVDAMLQQLLILERHRIAGLLRQFIVVDAARSHFQITAVEGRLEFVAGHIRLPLRFDRIDTLDDDGSAILDYKTGSKKRLLNRQNAAEDIQLFVYAAALDSPVSALALVNIDSREISFDGAGSGYTDVEAWSDLLEEIKSDIFIACEKLSAGDVRVNIEQGLQSARPLNLLTRFTELRRERG
jgi:ATP-dependent helicase/nuclease subunit B